jgi:hypothetical protein
MAGAWLCRDAIAARLMGVLAEWRRERDSNPRYGFPYTHFPGVRLQPLGHPSSTIGQEADVTTARKLADSLLFGNNLEPVASLVVLGQS